MSMAALMKAATAKIRTALKVNADSCRPRFGGRPPASCGEEFIAVHSGPVRGGQRGSRQDDYGLLVTITRKTGYAPDDRLEDDVVLKATAGMDGRTGAVIAALNGLYDYVGSANATIGAGASGFITPLYFQDWTETEVGPEWFGSEGEDDCGVARTIVFGGARRNQSIETQA